ncbi:MAG: DUF2249 domain-containing protein [Armatimonadota bacterium]|nr:DUF2249 domain-containing protein [Armatimonadota bacterium]
MAKTVRLDVRELPPYERHPLIFETWESLEVGDTLELVNDHDPRPLHYQFMMEHEGEFEWHSEEKGFREWVAEIRKLGAPKAAV